MLWFSECRWNAFCQCSADSPMKQHSVSAEYYWISFTSLQADALKYIYRSFHPQEDAGSQGRIAEIDDPELYRD